MPTCTKCGRKGFTLRCDSNGFCDECSRKMVAEDEARKREEVRRNNYYACRENHARPNVQRIYDAFVSKYPDALISGIGVHDKGDKLLIFLDGKPAYYATFNALTSSADLVKYVDPSLVPMNSQTSKKSSGCLSTLLIVLGLFLFLICLVGLGSSGDTGDTARVTAIPTATAPADNVVAWVSYHANRSVADDVSFRSVEETTSAGEKILVIKFFLSPMSTEKHYRVAAAQTIIQAGESVRSGGYHIGYDSVNFLFYGGFIDQYGNRKESLGIRAWYTAEELSLLNFDYFDSFVYSNPDAIIKAADDYIIHPAYQDQK